MSAFETSAVGTVRLYRPATCEPDLPFRRRPVAHPLPQQMSSFAEGQPSVLPQRHGAGLGDDHISQQSGSRNREWPSSSDAGASIATT
jgi:hypothetical protein